MGIEVKIVANLMDPEECRVAILEEGRLAELFSEKMWERHAPGEIYKARVDSVLPGMHSAFVNLGDGRNGFLYLADARNVTVEPNREILVQVIKSARKSKGARVTTRLSLPGRYLVLVPGGKDVGISRRITREDERKRLRRTVRGLRPEGCGVIVRTVAEGMESWVIEKDLQELQELWERIRHDGEVQKAPCLLYRNLGLLERVLRDELNDRVDEIIIDSPEEEPYVRTMISRFCQGAEEPEVNLYRGKVPLFETFGIEREIAAALERKQWLPSGAYLIIDQTEALTVIDVNTGKYVGTSTLRETIRETNLEAAREIARQLRLRAIGGIVVVDFIDMDAPEDREVLLEELEEHLRKDRSSARVFAVTRLGLVEMTRKRGRQDLKTALTRGCPFCKGNGWVLKEEEVAFSIKRFIRKVAQSSHSEAYVIEAHPDICRHMAENYLASWEEEFEARFFLVEVPEFAWDKFRMGGQGSLEQIRHICSLMSQKETHSVVHSTTASS
ncbi:MAG TPA: Rne/Rng family ribonuclease [Synergistaceae bacterium]|nr:Rne/Rng family ribonuclease [Synergistaceae bacterium]HPJ24745.1 Rne/Rng family ribonuclease [Synergistaceae bacterium]HPQ37086.1 Rne/Rng family ribonuclease [Synergistaceae bacterium]